MSKVSVVFVTRSAGESADHNQDASIGDATQHDTASEGHSRDGAAAPPQSRFSTDSSEQVISRTLPPAPRLDNLSTPSSLSNPDSNNYFSSQVAPGENHEGHTEAETSDRTLVTQDSAPVDAGPESATPRMPRRGGDEPDVPHRPERIGMGTMERHSRNIRNSLRQSQTDSADIEMSNFPRASASSPGLFRDGTAQAARNGQTRRRRRGYRAQVRAIFDEVPGKVWGGVAAVIGTIVFILLVNKYGR